MKELALIICLAISLFCTAQTDFKAQDELLLNAHRLFSEKTYKEALHNYEKAFDIDNANSAAEYLNAAVCAAELGDKQTCEKWLFASVTNKKVSKTTLRSFSENAVYLDCLELVLNEYDRLLSSYFNNLKNPSAYFAIQKLINRDQFVRKLSDYHSGSSEEQQEEAFNKYIEAQEKKDTVALKKYKAVLFPKVSKAHKEYQLQIMRYTDSLNIVELMAITKTHGWQEEAHLLLWHQRGNYGKENWVWNYFKPLINDEIKSGEIAPSFWAIFEDFKSINETGTSVYGHHPGKVNSETVNANRQSIGLPILTKDEIEQRNKNPFGGRVF